MRPLCHSMCNEKNKYQINGTNIKSNVEQLPQLYMQDTYTRQLTTF